MKKIFKKLLILITFIILIISAVLLWIIYQFNFQKYNIEKIDTSFFTNELKNEIIDISNIIKNKNISYIKIYNNEVKYYDINNNSLLEDEVEWLNIVSMSLLKNNVSYLKININNNLIIERIDLNFEDKKYTYIYEIESHNYSKWYIIPVLAWRIEEVIDENWYIFRICDRSICQEPQR